MRTSFTIFYIIFFTQICISNTYYLDPINGKLENDGSLQNPWPSLEEVINADLIKTQSYTLPYSENSSVLIPVNPNGIIQAGDTIILLNGLHGKFELRGAHNKDFITIKANESSKAILHSVNITAGSNWRFEDITISQEPYNDISKGHHMLFQSHNWHGPAHNIQVTNCNIYSIQDNTSWSAEDWVNLSSRGIRMEGDNFKIDRCRMKNISFGIDCIGDSITVSRCIIENFSGDGIRVLGSDILIEDNVIKNCYDVDDNHDDGIQSFNLGQYDLYNVKILRNTIINYEDINQPFRGPLQGIGCFDGPYNNWVIENNVISVDHWHGISMYGAYNCTINHNTVIDPTPDITPGPSWIRINPDKEGNESENNIVANNISNNFVLTGSTEYTNLKFSTEEEYNLNFVDWKKYIFKLFQSSEAIDAANDLYSPERDRSNISRPFGLYSDIGAFEFHFTTDIDEILTADIIVFPNPTSGRLNINLDDQIVKIYTIDGQFINNKFILNNKIDLSELSNGIYFLQNLKGQTIKIMKK